jgi:hypothetical protein
MKISTKFLVPAFAAVLAFTGEADAQVYATSFSNYNPGPLADGVSPITAVRPQRSNPNNAVGTVNAATNDNNLGEGTNPVQFVSLGYGGSIELQFSTPICNVAGYDMKIWETSYGNSSNCVAWPERAAVWARQNDCQPWILLTDETGGCLDFEVDLGVLSWASQIRIEDRTDETTPIFQSSNQDAFDVDGVEGYVGCAAPVVAPGAENSPFAITSLTQGLRNNGTPIQANRSIQSKMLGAPQASDASTSPANYNFYSLGYAGTVTLQFPYTVLNGVGADVQAYETTFGDNPARTCSSYPEKARYEGSVDGVTFFDMEAVPTGDDAGAVLCRDGKLNIPAAYAGINYIRITDLTVIGTIPGLSDGYDVDGLMALGQCGSTAGSGREDVVITDKIGEGEYTLNVYPNPAEKLVSVEINAANTVDNYTVTVTDVMGRIVSRNVIANNGASTIVENIDISAVPAGVYMVSVETSEILEVSRFVKK